MKKHISKLDDLVQAARTEAPVVSFEETARQIASLEEKRRKPLWTMLRDAYAFPLRQMQYWKGAWNLEGLAQSTFAKGAFVRGFAGVCAVMLVMAVFPALIHDLSLPEIRLENIVSSEIAPMPNTVSKQMFADVLPTKSSNEKSSMSLSTSSAKNTPPNSPESSIAASFPVAVIADSVIEQSNASSNPSSKTSSSAEHGINSDVNTPLNNHLRKNSADIALAATALPEQERNSSKQYNSSQKNNASTQGAERSLGQVETTIFAPNEQPTFWQRLSLEARMAARTDLAVSAASNESVVFAADQNQQAFSSQNTAATPLQNIALGMYYAVSNEHTIGIEGGSEPFFTAQMQRVASNNNVVNSMNSMTNTPTGIVSMPSNTVGINLAPSQGTGSRSLDVAVRTATNRTWIGAAYQYNAEAWDVLGGVQPLARITFGGGELGAVGRTLVGAKFLSRERFSFVLAGEGAAVASQLLGAWNLTPRLGITLGLSVKF